MDNTRVYNCDCLQGMAAFDDGYFELAIVDVPYGIDWMKQIQNPNVSKNWKKYNHKTWDENVPNSAYFDELTRVSQNQIVWGANHIGMFPASPCWIIWDKIQEFSGAEFEMAWTSFSSPAKAFRLSRVEAYVNQNKIHPTQKPVALYKWLLKNYAKEGDKILDTHGGSMSSVIACLEMGFSITCYEKDPDYYQAAKKRIEQYLAQGNLFKEKQQVLFA